MGEIVNAVILIAQGCPGGIENTKYIEQVKSDSIYTLIEDVEYNSYEVLSPRYFYLLSILFIL